MTPTVIATQLCKAYTTAGARVEVLRDVSVELSAGQLTALVGRSGSGKSSLLSVLGALTLPDSGSVRVNGVDLAGLGSAAAARLRGEQIGFVFQAFNLLPHLTAAQNVALPHRRGVRAGATRARELLGRLGLAERAGHRPGELSAGEQQRVALARALVNEPSVILADEPTGNLDGETEQQLLALFRQIAGEGRTVLVVTHNDAVAASADRVLRMHAGRLEAAA
ncbi:MAG: putative transport system ATP-binding protein [Pseudonocardiales bacterium]|jgi:ABC-type lipoprotein export system ATPase subunit|nr:putative transport system ATP-binding protein [Pseudonocardiales bacterium]